MHLWTSAGRLIVTAACCLNSHRTHVILREHWRPRIFQRRGGSRSRIRQFDVIWQIFQSIRSFRMTGCPFFMNQQPAITTGNPAAAAVQSHSHLPACRSCAPANNSMPRLITGSIRLLPLCDPTRACKTPSVRTQVPDSGVTRTLFRKHVRAGVC